ncbi:MAG: translocation protein TolB [Acidobacteria bacterium]|nr:MAG: translocation protein TolB [Acidobacteriota bacterium]
MTVPILMQLLVTTLTMFSPQEPDIVIRPPITGVTRLAVADFQPKAAASAEADSALKVFNEVVWKDLDFSAFFEMKSKSFYPVKPIRVPTDVTFDEWQTSTVNADFLVFGNLQLSGGGAVVEAYLYDVKTKQQVLGKRFTAASTTLIRNVAHSFADEIVFQLSAATSRGIARTQIAFSSQKGDSKEVYIVDYDGANPRTVTANGGLNKFPEWSPDNTRLAFVTKLPNSSRWEIWIQELAGGRTVLPTPSSYASSPAVSPDGQRAVFSSRSQDATDSDVYVASLSGGGMRNLTNHRGIDTSPCWSPTGQQIAFISDRSGGPQVWVMDADGSNVRRLVSEGGHCDSPEWSPDGRLVAYSWQAPTQWKHDVYVVEVATGKIFQLTVGGASNESPHWSPDGRHIVFQSTRSGSKQIFIMNADGKNVRQITAYGINESPAWSGYSKRDQ